MSRDSQPGDDETPIGKKLLPYSLGVAVPAQSHSQLLALVTNCHLHDIGRLPIIKTAHIAELC